ncbi:helix-turn-helix domain-containing protein [Actinoallomurus sp. NPDC050550]
MRSLSVTPAPMPTVREGLEAAFGCVRVVWNKTLAERHAA